MQSSGASSSEGAASNSYLSVELFCSCESWDESKMSLSDDWIEAKAAEGADVADARFTGEWSVSDVDGRLHYEIAWSPTRHDGSAGEHREPARLDLSDRSEAQVSETLNTTEQAPTERLEAKIGAVWLGDIERITSVTYTDIELMHSRLTSSGVEQLPPMPGKGWFPSTCNETARGRLASFRPILSAAMEAYRRSEDPVIQAVLHDLLMPIATLRQHTIATAMQRFGGRAIGTVQAASEATDYALRTATTVTLGSGVAAALLPVWVLDGVVYVACWPFDQDPHSNMYGRILRRSMAFLTVDCNPYCHYELLPGDIPATRPGGSRVIFVCNHTSFTDVMVLSKALPWEMKFLSMGSLASWPVVGGMMKRANDVFVHFEQDETGKWRATNTTEALGLVEERVLQGMPFMIFPEGRLRGDGHLNDFKHGAFKVALRTGADIVPVALTGASDLLPPGQSLLNHSTVRVKVGAPIDTKKWTRRVPRSTARALDETCGRTEEECVEALRQQAQDEVQTLLDELLLREVAAAKAKAADPIHPTLVEV